MNRQRIGSDDLPRLSSVTAESEPLDSIDRTNPADRSQQASKSAGSELLHWQPPPAPQVVSHDFRFPTEPLITGWNRALERPVAVEVAAVPLNIAAPRAIQISIRRPPIRVRSFEFPEPSEAPHAGLPIPAAAPGKAQAAGGAETQRHADSPAGGRDQAGRPPELSPATAVGGAALRSRVGDAVPAVSLSVRRRGVPLSAACGDPGR